MIKLRLVLGSFLICLLAARQAWSLPVYFNTSSATLSLNTLDSIATNSSSSVTLLTATGPSLNRCTAVAMDALNGKLFFVDASSDTLWSANLDGSNPVLIHSGLTSYPLDLALDVLNEKIYYASSSSVQNNNTVQRIDYTGNNNTTVFTATGPSPGNGVSRCTALALDTLHAKLFLADAGSQKVWSMSLTGSGLTPLATSANAYPTGLAVDAAHQRVYFTTSSTVQSANSIQRVNYDGTGLTTLFSASGTVQRCTSLDLDAAAGVIYLSDAGANTLWRVPSAGGTATALVSGLPATVRKVRWYSGPATRPPPGLSGFQLVSGTNILFNATNGYAGGTYYVLTSTNLTSPLSQWLPILTNVLGASGSFTLTASNAVNLKLGKQFYILRVQ